MLRQGSFSVPWSRHGSRVPGHGADELWKPLCLGTLESRLRPLRPNKEVCSCGIGLTITFELKYGCTRWWSWKGGQMVVAGISEVKSNMHSNEDSIVHDHNVYTSAEARDCSEQNMWGDWSLLLYVGGLQTNSVNITDCVGLCTSASMPGHRTTLAMWKLTGGVEGGGVQSCTERNNRARSENTLQLFKQFRSRGFHQMLPNFKQLNELQAIRCWAAWRRPPGIMLSPSLLHSSYQAPYFTLVIHLQHEFHQQGGSGYIRCYRDLSYRHICIFRVAFFFYWQLIKLA